jgi:hypothetical protein
MSTTLSSLSEQTHSGREQIKHARFGLSAFSWQPQVWALVVLAEPIAPIERVAQHPSTVCSGFRWFRQFFTQ